MTKLPPDPGVKPTDTDPARATGPPADDAAPPTIQLRLGRVFHGLRFVDISQITGVHPETVRRYLTRTSPSIEFVVTVARHFGVSLDWLLLGTGPSRVADVAHDHLASAPLADLVAVVEERLSRLKSDASPEGAQRRMLATRLHRITVPFRTPDGGSIPDVPAGP